MTNVSETMRDTGTHLDARTLATERQPRANGQHSPEKLNGNQRKCCVMHLSIGGSFAARNPTPGRERGKSADQPSRNRRGPGARRGNEQEPAHFLTVRPDD